MLGFTDFCDLDYLQALVHEFDLARQDGDATKGKKQKAEGRNP